MKITIKPESLAFQQVDLFWQASRRQPKRNSPGLDNDRHSKAVMQLSAIEPGCPS